MLLHILQGTGFYLLQLVLALDSLHPFLLHVSVGGLPHVVVLNNVLHRFPRQEIRPDVVESLPILLHGLFEEASLSSGPVLHLICGKVGTGTFHQLEGGLGKVVLALVQQLHRVEEGDVSGGGRCRHVQAEKRLLSTFLSCKTLALPWLLESACGIHSSGESSDASAQHEELINSFVRQVVVRTPDELLQVLLPPGVLLHGDDRVQAGHLRLVAGPYLDLPTVLEEGFVGAVVDQGVEERVLGLDVGEQGFSLVQQGDRTLPTDLRFTQLSCILTKYQPIQDTHLCGTDRLGLLGQEKLPFVHLGWILLCHLVPVFW